MVDGFLKRYPDIALIGVENHAFGMVGAGKTQLAELHGKVKDVILDYGIPVAMFATTTIKKEATGDSGASKPEMIQAAKSFGFKGCYNDDEADAYWAAVTGSRRIEPF